MKKQYRRKAWYVVDRFIVDGYTDKYGFHVTDTEFEDYKKIVWHGKKNIFYNFEEAVNELEKRYGCHAVFQYFKDY